MSYSNQTTTTKSAAEGYQIILKTLPEQGFTISRRRDLANLAQGTREIDGVTRTFNVSCQMGKETKVNVACMTDGDPSANEIAAVDNLLAALKTALSA
jgi:hypothetical protein